MPTNILMPALSPTMEKGNLAKWLKKEGDTVKSGDIIAEIETDKATMEFEAVDEGTIGKILCRKARRTSRSTRRSPSCSRPAKRRATSRTRPQPRRRPRPRTPRRRRPRPLRAEAPKAAAPAASAPKAAPAPAAAATNGSGNRAFASPLARRMAKEAGIDLARVAGSGPHGRVVKSDIEAAASGKAPLAAKASPSAPAGAPAVAPSMSDAQIMKLFDEGEYSVVPHDNVRKIIARRWSRRRPRSRTST